MKDCATKRCTGLDVVDPIDSIPINQPKEPLDLLDHPYLLLLFIIIGMSCLVPLIMFSYDNFFHKEPIYIPNYKTLRDNLTMPDGRTFWDDNNQTDAKIALQILVDYIDRKIEVEGNTNMSMEDLFNNTQNQIYSKSFVAVHGGKA